MNIRCRVNNFIFKFVFVIISLFMFFIFSVSSFASEIECSFVVEQYIKTDTAYSKPKDKFTYVLEPLTKNAPLPNSQKDKFLFSLLGEESVEIKIKGFSSGEYLYKLYQQKRDDLDGCIQDEIVYTILIKTRSINGAVCPYVSLIKDNVGYKHDRIKFINKYNIAEKGNVPRKDNTNKEELNNKESNVKVKPGKVVKHFIRSLPNTAINVNLVNCLLLWLISFFFIFLYIKKNREDILDRFD